MTVPTLQIALLGNFRLMVDGTMATGMRLRSQQLIAYLILHRQAPQARRHIAGQFWPDIAEGQARTNLRKELHHLRHNYPVIEQLLTVTKQTLQWQPQRPCEVDVEVFEDALERAKNQAGTAAVNALEIALNAYQDDLWPDCDAEWIYAEQERLRQQYVGALTQITQLLQGLGETSRAISTGQQWLQAAPLDENSYQTLMTLHGESGDRATALQLYHQCMTTLQEELGVNPSPATAEIYQRLLMAEDAIDEPSKDQAPPPVALSLQPKSAVVGREDLLEILEQWLLATPESVLLLTGEPGIGKTCLLEALADSALEHHWQPSWGRAFGAEQLRSYGVWIDLLRASFPPEEFPTLNEFFTVQQQPRDRSQLLDAVVQTLSKVASTEKPLLLIFDDIHWLDEASANLLHYVFRLLGQGALRIACSARLPELQDNTAAHTLVKSLRRANRLQEVPVPPLSPDAIELLVQPILGQQSASPSQLQDIYIDSGGNPLFALEVVRSSTLDAANDLTGLIEDRLQRLDGAARDLLPWAAALGRHFNPETLALAASYPPMQFLTAMEQLEQQQIVRPTPEQSIEDQGNYDFVHDLVRQAAYGQLSQPRRRLIHGQLAKTLETQTIDDDLASQVAYHAGLSGNHGLAARSSTAAAARSLRLFAYEDVIRLVNQGLVHCNHLPSSDRLLLSAQLLRARAFAGVAPDEVASLEVQLQQLLTDAINLSMSEAQVIAEDTLNIFNYERGHLKTVQAQTLKALEDLPPSPQFQAKSLAATGCCLAEIERDMKRAEAILLEAQTLADRLGLVLADIATGLGGVERHRGNYGQARIYLQKSLQINRSRQEFMPQSYALLQLVMTGWDQHQPNVSDAQALLELSGQLPAGSEGTFAEALIALHTYADDANANVLLEQTIQQLQQLDAQRKLVFVTSHASELALAHGERGAAQRYAAISNQAAQQVDHPNDVAVAKALLVLSASIQEQKQEFYKLLKKTIGDYKSLSARAQSLSHQAQHAVEQSIAKIP